MPKAVRVQKHLRRREHKAERSIRRKKFEVERMRRGGYTYTKYFRFDIDDRLSMSRVYDALGQHVMYVIGTRGLGEGSAFEPITPRTERGVGLWWWQGKVYADEVMLLFDVPEKEASRVALGYNQKSMAVINGKTRDAFLLSTKYDRQGPQARLPLASGGDVPSSIYLRSAEALGRRGR